MRALHDGHGRSVRYLRLSVTDRCNLRCLYCRSNARQRCIPHAQVLRYEEMARMVGIAAALGIGPERVNVKATTEEGLGFTGDGSGMAAHAVVLLELLG